MKKENPRNVGYAPFHIFGAATPRYIEKENPRNFCKLKMKLRCGEKQRIKCKRKQKKLLKIIETRNKNHYRYLSLLAVFDIPKHYVLSA